MKIEKQNRIRKLLESKWIDVRFPIPQIESQRSWNEIIF